MYVLSPNISTMVPNLRLMAITTICYERTSSDCRMILGYSFVISVTQSVNHLPSSSLTMSLNQRNSYITGITLPQQLNGS